MSLKTFHVCCENARPTLFGRGVAAAKWIAPSAMLVLLPKCPFCVAAYIALVTGIGVSVATASFLRYGMIFLCVASLAYLIGTSFRHFGR